MFELYFMVNKILIPVIRLLNIHAGCYDHKIANGC